MCAHLRIPAIPHVRFSISICSPVAQFFRFAARMHGCMRVCGFLCSCARIQDFRSWRSGAAQTQKNIFRWEPHGRPLASQTASALVSLGHFPWCALSPQIRSCHCLPECFALFAMYCEMRLILRIRTVCLETGQLSMLGAHNEKRSVLQWVWRDHCRTSCSYFKMRFSEQIDA